MANRQPHDELAEQSLLGAMMIANQTIPHVMGRVEAADFYLPKHQWIYSAISAIFSVGGAVDPVAVGTELEKAGQFRKIGGAPYLLDLTQVVPLASNANRYADVVLEKAKLRRMGELGVRLQQLSLTEGHDSSELIAQAQQYFREVDRPDSSAVSFAELVEIWQKWDEQSDDMIATPWPEVNDWLNGGLAKGRMVTIGGRPSVGKSLGGLNIASYAAQNGRTAVFFSLEMSKPEVATRVLAWGASAEMGELTRRRLTADGLAKVSRFALDNKLIPLWVDDRERITVEQIAAKCRAIPKLDVIVVDYLQLVTASDPKASREQQVAHISRSLKILARELDVAVVVAAQLNRGPVKDGKPRDPTIADLRESGAVEQDSDQVLLLHRDADDEGVVHMICGKNRTGKTGRAQLLFEGNFARLSPLTEDEVTWREVSGQW